MTTPEANKALQQAKIQLMMKPDSAFFTTVCFSLLLDWDSTVPTAAVNTKRMGINPDFFMALHPEERISLMLHETLHVALLHPLRLMGRNHKKWNMAGDFVINQMLHERGFRIPKNWLLDSRYAGMSTEEVYDLLPDPPESYSMDLQESDGSVAPDVLEQDVVDILVRAKVHAEMSDCKPGTIPGEIQIFLDKLLKPKLPWHRILYKYLRAKTKSDYTFRKPSRRYFPTHILPSLYTDHIIDLAIAVDASGSVSDDEFKQFVSEIHMILRMMKPENITLLHFDTEIRHIDTVKTVQALSQVVFTGRGGTYIHPVIDWAKEKRPQVLLVFSDGYFDFYNDEPPGEVVWIIHNNPQFKPPYGTVIHYEV